MALGGLVRAPHRLQAPPASQGGSAMKAMLNGHVIAASDDIVEFGGYQYFPPAAVRMEWLEKVAKTDSDLACPHGVQFYDVVIEGKRHARNAWIYEAPQPKLAQIKDRVGFWEDVELR
jgi:uncharacterized protein (DUF427 family)